MHRVVVIGAGFGGLFATKELAGQLAELSHRSLRGNFTSFDPAATRIVRC